MLCPLVAGPDGWNGMIPLVYKAGECPVPYTKYVDGTWLEQSCNATMLISYNTCFRCGGFLLPGGGGAGWTRTGTCHLLSAAYAPRHH
jgi:hypothetical protein